MALSILDYLNGLFSLLLVLISVIVAIQILSKYFRYKEKAFIYVGLTWIGVITPWFPSSIGFIYYLITLQPLPDIIYILLGLLVIPVMMIVWIYGFTNYLINKHQKILLPIYIIVGIIFEIYLLTGLFGNYESFIGIKDGILDISYSNPIKIFLLLYVISFLISGLLFGRISLKSENREIRLKGIFLIVAFIFYFTGALIDAAIPLTPGLLVITRIILIVSAILFDIGFFFPKFIKKLFLS
jgi:hypothetical protein